MEVPVLAQVDHLAEVLVGAEVKVEVDRLVVSPSHRLQVTGNRVKDQLRLSTFLNLKCINLVIISTNTEGDGV
ncbi:hypothetical protein [Paenibacillus sp. PAMC 26794]|uniref:hypothetical protein n=1 Tax=Paenibacillus sp. PAMC 26794 TaxID=1257080 RepID=UPI00036885B5|nr:hypothetical protein [Paenibacillus sp. PAMC 26794]